MSHTKKTPGVTTTGQVAEAPTSTQNHADYTTNDAASQERIRIDFTVNDDGTTTVIKFVRRGTDRPYSSGVKPPGFDLDAALAWCREHGYYVVTWPGGARAWKDEGPGSSAPRARSSGSAPGSNGSSIGSGTLKAIPSGGRN
jgi:hypothetical protein